MIINYRYTTAFLCIAIACTVLGGLYINLQTVLPMIEGSSLKDIKLDRFVAPIDTTTVLKHSTHTCISDVRPKGSVTYPAVPDFIIAGAQKSGTSALSAILSQHPAMLSGRGKLSAEGHFFNKMFRDKALNVVLYQPGNRGNVSAAFKETHWCSLGFRYQKKIFSFKPGISSHGKRGIKQTKQRASKQRKKKRTYNRALEKQISFEKTPAYMVFPHVPELISIVCPWRPKIVMLLRNPIDRAYSHFDMGGTHDNEFMDKARDGNYTFEELVASNMDTMEKKGILLEGGLPNPKWTRHEQSFNITHFYRNVVWRGFYANQIEHWLEHFPLGEKLMIVQYERFNENKKAVIDEILEFVGASQYNYTDDVLHQNYFRKNKTNIVEGVSDGMRSYLKKVYKPHNDRLADLLGEEWRDVWD